MPFLGSTELKSLLPSCIDKYNSERIDNVAYELGLGDEAYLTDSKSGKKEKLNDKNPQVVIKPGQFALLLTEEIVTIPKHLLAFISIKFSQKIKGLINVSGFHVDPGFHGKIIFSVYNAGPATIVLDKGRPYFMMWFCTLTSDATPYNGKHNGQNNISAENISDLKGELASPNALLKRIIGNETKLASFSVVAGVLMTIGVGLSIKSIIDTSKFNEGYNAGLMEKRSLEYIDSALSKTKVDSIVSYKIDSVLKRFKNDTSNKK
jgi:dCTP deaminase